MSNSDTCSQETNGIVNPRLRRGVTEYMTVFPGGGDIYSVSSQSGREYRVDAREGRCTCLDFHTISMMATSASMR